MIKFAISILIVFVTVFSVNAQSDLPDPMFLPRMVNDFAGIYTSAQTNDLENMLRAYHDSTTTQIYVVSVNTLNGDAPYNYGAQLGEKWGIGQKGKDNGVLILLNPKNEEGSGQVYIATGYGVEARLTDAIAGRIIENDMIPHLRENNDYYTATKEAVYAIIRQLSGEFTPTTPTSEPQSFMDEMVDNILGFFACCCILPLFIFLMIFSKNFRRLVFFFLLLGGRGGGGGRSGGGFGGGGGGRFGGGGAGRSW